MSFGHRQHWVWILDLPVTIWPFSKHFSLCFSFLINKEDKVTLIVVYITAVVYIRGSIASGKRACDTSQVLSTHSSALAWRIPWMEEPGRLQSMGLLRVRHDWVTSLSLFTFMHWRRKWQLPPVFLPGESQGQRSLLDSRLWGRTESDTTDVT